MQHELDQHDYHRLDTGDFDGLVLTKPSYARWARLLSHLPVPAVMHLATVAGIAWVACADKVQAPTEAIASLALICPINIWLYVKTERKEQQGALQSGAE